MIRGDRQRIPPSLERGPGRRRRDCGALGSPVRLLDGDGMGLLG
jgi:hypothetical protein